MEGVGGEVSTNARANSAHAPLPCPRSPKCPYVPVYPLEILERGDPVSGPLRPIPGYTPFRA